MREQVPTIVEQAAYPLRRPKCLPSLTLIVQLLAIFFLIAASPRLHAQSVGFAGAQSTVPATGLNAPNDVAVDGKGDLFIADSFNDRVVELPWTGGGYGAQTTVASGLDNPVGVAVDKAGDLFVVDYNNSQVVEVPWTGSGYITPRVLPATGLNGPGSVAVDGTGNVFITDAGNNRVVELSGSGYGTQTTVGSGLDDPTGVAVDGAGDVFIADLGNNRVVEVPLTVSGYGTETTIPATGLNGAQAVAVDRKGDVFIVDYNNNRVVELPSTGGGYDPQITIPATGLLYPSGVTVDGAGDVFIADGVHSRVVEVQTQLTNLGTANVCAAGQTSPSPCNQTVTLVYDVTTGSTLGTPQVLTQGAPNLDFTLASGSTCTGAVMAVSTCTVNVTFRPQFAGLRSGAVHIVDNSGNVLASTLVYGTGEGPQIAFGPGTQSAVGSGLNQPQDVALDGKGDVFIVDTGNNRVVEVPANGGGQTTIADSGLNNPQGVAVDGAGDVFIADTDNYRVLELPWTGSGYGAQTTLLADGSILPAGVAVDGGGNVFLTDYLGDGVIELPWTGSGYGPQITLLTGGLDGPLGIAVDGKGDVFIADSGNSRVVELPWTESGYSAQVTVLSSGLSYPFGVAVDGAGDVFIADTGNSRVVELPWTGSGYGAQVAVPVSGLNSPLGVTVDATGNIFIEDRNDISVVELQRSQPPSLSFASTNVGQTSSDSPKSVTVENIGNQPLNAIAPGVSISANFTQVPGSGTPADCSASFSLTPGASCNLSISFKPEEDGTINGAAVLTDNALNGNPATQSITLTGTGVATAPTLSFVVPNQTYGAAPFAVNATSNSTGAITYSVVSGPATISGNILTLTGPGTVVLLASQVAAGGYSAGSIQASFNVTGQTNIHINNDNDKLSFGVFPFGQTGTNQITFGVVINNGTPQTTQISVAFTNSPSNFSVISNGCSSAHSGYSSYCQVTIGFTQPTTLAGLSQSYNGTLSFTSSNPNFGFVGGGTVAVTAGSAKLYTNAPLTTAATPYNFGNANNGSTGTTLSFQIFNPSGWNNSGAPAPVTLSNYNNWNRGGTCNGYLSDDSQCTMTLQFKGSYPPGQTNNGTLIIGNPSGIQVWNVNGSAAFGTLYLTGKTN
jgi:large repetitive protein